MSTELPSSLRDEDNLRQRRPVDLNVREKEEASLDDAKTPRSDDEEDLDNVEKKLVKLKRFFLYF
jgi:hypothetical protein